MRYLSHDGVRLAFTDAGSGDPPILLVHGMRCNHAHMQPLFDHFSQRHRVVAVDQRGHGESDKPQGSYSNDVMSADLQWLCTELGIDRPVAIGHSFGGSVLLYLAWRQPELFGGLVLLDSGVRSTEEKEAELGKVVHRSPGASEPEGSRAFLAGRLFGPDDSAGVKNEILDVMATSVPEHAGAAMGQTVLEFDSGSAAAQCTVPALLVLADRPFTTPAMIDRLGSNWRVGQVVGAGHFVQIFGAAQVIAMVERFLELLDRPVATVQGSSTGSSGAR